MTAALIALAIEPEPWMKDAACAAPGIDPELFYPQPGDNGNRGRRICNRCPIRRRCLEYALTIDDRFGTWGGMGPADRDDIRIGKPIRNRIDHGSPTGARTHRRRGQPPCTACIDAETAAGPSPCADPNCTRRFSTFRGALLHHRRVHEGFNPHAPKDGAA